MGRAEIIEDATLQEPREAAAQAGLHYVSDEDPGITRRRSGKGFAYYQAGRLVRDPQVLKRIRSLAVPPAYRDVWISPDPLGHIQATGRDDRGRKQYRYHPRWSQIRDETKYGRMIEFAQALPAIRAQVANDMRKRGLARERVLATVVNLLETTLIRVGNEDYARSNKSYGLTTLRTRHVAVEGAELRFEFKGKSGKIWKLSIRDRRVARLVKTCQELPGQHLFQYIDADGARQAVTSADVNAYLREISGRDFTAKDFRTWAGTVLAAMALCAHDEALEGAARTKRYIKAAIDKVAARLGNTPTICRKCYVHPEVFAAYLDGDFITVVRTQVVCEEVGQLKPEEAAVLALLLRRAARDMTACTRMAAE
jgi:DNA topoisomerase-1